MSPITKFPKINDILSFFSQSLENNLYLYEKYLSLRDLKSMLCLYYFYHLDKCFYYKNADCYVPPYYYKFDCIDGVNTFKQISKGTYFMTLIGGGKGLSINEYHTKYCIKIENKWLLNNGHVKL